MSATNPYMNEAIAGERVPQPLLCQILLLLELLDGLGGVEYLTRLKSRNPHQKGECRGTPTITAQRSEQKA
jgi:hypothetical protein